MAATYAQCSSGASSHPAHRLAARRWWQRRRSSFSPRSVPCRHGPAERQYSGLRRAWRSGEHWPWASPLWSAGCSGRWCESGSRTALSVLCPPRSGIEPGRWRSVSNRIRPASRRSDAVLTQERRRVRRCGGNGGGARGYRLNRYLSGGRSEAIFTTCVWSSVSQASTPRAFASERPSLTAASCVGDIA